MYRHFGVHLFYYIALIKYCKRHPSEQSVTIIFYKNILLKRVCPDSHINYIVLSDCQTHISQKLRQCMCLLSFPLPLPESFHPTSTEASFFQQNHLIGENVQTLD